MKGFKGFSKDWKCLDKQYEVGKTFEEPEAELCKKGLHFCEHPLDVFGYYFPGDMARFAEVEADEIAEKRQEGKLVCKKLTIKAELSLKGMIEAAVSFVFDQANWTEEKTSEKDNDGVVANDKSGAALATGNGGAASATGYGGAASATGYRGAASATGNGGAASATGYGGAASATSYRGAASATGYGGAASATGYRGAASATGNRGAASATGYGGAASATGNGGAASATGKNGFASALGINGRAKAALGNWITLAEWERDENFDWQVKEFKSAKIDGEVLMPDTWYWLKDGKVTICEEME
jgi:hypothetical protein